MESPEGTTVTTGAAGTSVSTAGVTVTTTDQVEHIGVKEYILYKLDRTLAVVGLILIAMWVCALKLPEGMQIVNTAVGGLIGYICGRGTQK
jgi:hypothetical protein